MSRNDGNLSPTKTADSSVTEDNPTSEEQGNKHSHVPSDIALRVKALESVLTEKNLIDPSALDAVVDRYKNKVGPQNGAKVVAKAWVDSDYKRRLLKDGSSAIAELLAETSIGFSEAPAASARPPSSPEFILAETVNLAKTILGPDSGFGKL